MRITDANVDPRFYLYQRITTYILLAAAALLCLSAASGGPRLDYLFAGILALTAVISRSLFGRLQAEVRNLKADLSRVQADKDSKYDDIVRLYQSSQATSQEAEPGGIMDAVAEDARRLVNCDSASVAIFIEKDLLASVTKGISNEFKRNLRWRVRKGGMTELVLGSGKPLLIGDASADPRSRESSAVKIGGQRSIMAVPLMVEDETFGIMYAGDTEKNKFSERDLMLFTILANNAAASIKQARLQRELEKKLKELELAHKELIGADRLKAEFISTVTSQMRVPLDAIRTYSQTVLQRMDDTNFKLKEKFLGAVVDESAKLLNTVNGVIDLSRMEFGEGDLRKEAMSITDVLKDVCGVLDPVCIDKEIEIMIEAPGQVSQAYLDRDMIFLMYRNLLEAAISSSKAASPVRVMIDEDESFLTTRVSMVPSREVMEMEKAVQAVSTREAVPSDAGTLGLTLQVAKNIVFRHGGRIWAETHDPASWSLVVLFGKEKKAIMPSDLMLEIMTSRPELRRMLSLVTDMISKVIEVGSCELLLEDSATGKLVGGAGHVGKDGTSLVTMPAGGLSGKVYEGGRPVVLNSEMDLADSGIKETLPFERVPCASVPIRLKGKAVGVLTVADKHGSNEFFDEDDLALLAALGDRIGVAIERATSYESARDQFVSAMVAMKSVMEARNIPAGKSMDHAALVAQLARSMNVDEEEVKLLQYVSRIYDVGMVKVGEGILRKRGGL
ncbi:MAG: GAF domain-containing protein, partial [bacterium]